MVLHLQTACAACVTLGREVAALVCAPRLCIRLLEEGRGGDGVLATSCCLSYFPSAVCCVANVRRV